MTVNVYVFLARGDGATYHMTQVRMFYQAGLPISQPIGFSAEQFDVDDETLCGRRLTGQDKANVRRSTPTGYHVHYCRRCRRFAAPVEDRHSHGGPQSWAERTNSPDWNGK